MVREHDRWSKMGEENLGGPDGPNIRFAEAGRVNGGSDAMGFFTLMKCILNDHWADVPASRRHPLSPDDFDYIMSKLYYCWVRMLWSIYPEELEDDDGNILVDGPTDPWGIAAFHPDQRRLYE